MAQEPSDFEILVETLKSRIKVPQLKEILQLLGLKRGGIKNVLTGRIMDALKAAIASGDLQTYSAIRDAILQKVGAAPYSPRIIEAPQLQGRIGPILAKEMPPRSLFCNTPFFACLLPLTIGTIVLPSTTQATLGIHFQISQQVINKLRQNDQKYRLYLFCGSAAEAVLGRGLIEFPQVMAINVNGANLKQNLRGIKNRPGTTPPADITHLCNLWHGPPGNDLVLTYANTTKTFKLQVCLVEAQSVSKLVDKVVKGPSESIELTLNNLKNATAQDDVVATLTNISLKDPLSFKKINIPCRSRHCKHLQCFDATSYFQVNQLTPSWVCPVCNQSCLFEDLIISRYIQNILENTKSSVETVSIDGDGNWTIISAARDSDDSDCSKEQHHSNHDQADKKKSNLVDLTLSDSEEDQLLNSHRQPPDSDSLSQAHDSTRESTPILISQNEIQENNDRRIQFSLPVQHIQCSLSNSHPLEALANNNLAQTNSAASFEQNENPWSSPTDNIEAEISAALTKGDIEMLD